MAGRPYWVYPLLPSPGLSAMMFLSKTDRKSEAITKILENGAGGVILIVLACSEPFKGSTTMEEVRARHIGITDTTNTKPDGMEVTKCFPAQQFEY